jgi:hypothetical protein
VLSIASPGLPHTSHELAPPLGVTAGLSADSAIAGRDMAIG